MDNSSLIIIAAFVVYGIFEYQHREWEFRRMLHEIARGKTPTGRAQKPELWRLTTLASVGFLLLLFVASCIVGAFTKIAVAFTGPMLALGVVFAVPLIFLVLMFVRDVRAYRSSTEG